MTEEIWKSVADYPNYEVSDQGRVRNIKTGRILKPYETEKGYLIVDLFSQGKRKHFKVHRLVGLAFIPNPDNLPQINHRNEIKQDNRVSNLEWISAKDNNNYGSHNEKVALALGKPVEQFDLDGNYLRTWVSAMEAERQTGINNSRINECCHGKRQTTDGFIWRFAKKID